MKERPILFSGPMVKAILEGRKTQTRRVIKPSWIAAADAAGESWGPEGDQNYWAGVCPYGQPGDRVWVRETFVEGYPSDQGDLQMFDEHGNELPRHVWYRCDDKLVSQYGAPMEEWLDEDGAPLENIPWRPSIFMPRWASRITLEITGVRVERLNEISDFDAFQEGVKDEPGTITGPYCRSFVQGFKNIWESINGPGSWDENPWVWVIEFRRVNQ